jgi:hypothetical protein
VHDISVQHEEEVCRVQDQLRRERQRAVEDRAHFERECAQVGKVIKERTEAAMERVREEQEAKRRNMAKKHAV